jgi:hypothetical protein
MLQTRRMQRFVAALALCAGVSGWCQEPCTPDHVDLPKEQTSATAKSLANIVKSPGSLRVELAGLLRKAREQVTKAKPPGKACSSACGVAGPTRIHLSIVPQKLLASYADFRKCEERLRQTSNQPLRFGPRHARSADELAAWLSDLSQGRGRDGAALYRECDGRCSPRYSAQVVQDGDGLIATLEVVCGHARDRDDNTYIISSGYRWACVTSQ